MPELQHPETVAGRCLCGQISLSALITSGDVIACHCTQCRKQSGHYYSAFHVANRDLVVNGEEYLNWYRASNDAERGFCRQCGSALFWRHEGDDHTSILAGCIDHNAEVLETTAHIYVADKGVYYELCDGLPQFPGTDLS